MSKKSPKFSKQKLLDNSMKVFKQSQEVVAGALVGFNPDDELTIAEAKKKILEFRKKEVK